jgi:rhodanese-related sulfurtransferase
LRPEEFDALRSHALVVDARSMDDFARAHIPGSLSNPFRSAFAVWLGWLAPPDARVAFLVDEGALEPVLEESMLVGFEDFAGWLEEGMDAWTGAGLPTSSAEMVDPDAALRDIAHGAVPVDVREESELGAGLLPGAVHIPLGEVTARAPELPSGAPLVVYCSHGERASSAISLLEGAGVGPLVNLHGGMGAWRKAGHPVERPGSRASAADSR